jgi:DNA-binding GntR family transcriptional regulator
MPFTRLEGMARRENSETISAEVRDLIRDDIFSARWAPGTRLQIGELSQRYSASSTAVREALARLAGEKLLEFQPNRGFQIARLTLDELHDIGELRARVEEFGLGLAIARGDLAWESELIAVHHRLERTPRRRPDDPHHTSNEWFLAHQAFHAKLLEACGAPMLLEFAASLDNAMALYRLWTAPAPKAESRDVEAEHQAILEATLARDAPSAARLLREHYTRTIEIISEAEFPSTP